MSSRDVRAKRKAHSRNALNRLPALEALGAHVRDALRTIRSKAPAKTRGAGTTKG